MIASPDLTNSRSILADWIELRAVVSVHGAGEADLASVARLTSDEHRERLADESGHVAEEEILDGAIEEVLVRVSEEIGYRIATLGPAYPFSVQDSPFRVFVTPKELTVAHWMYLFLLLISAERDKALPRSEKISELIRRGRTLFHACASIGVAGLLRNANTIWFGWPRPDRTAFLPALAGLCEKLGFGRAKDQIPAGLPPRPKDDQIDIVGWRGFRDRRNGNLLVLCQAATGDDWDDKSVLNHVDAFREWFELPPYARAAASIAIPFPAHHEVIEHPEQDFKTAVHNALHRSQSRHGVLIDRLRIIESVGEVAAEATAAADRIGGIEKLPELKVWVTDAIEAMKEVG
jgi:hypothetical protein